MEDLGGNLAGDLKAGDLVFLSGPLGAGKTTLVRGVLRALGHTWPVRSPTFSLIHLFATEPPVCHVDLYRIEAGHEVEDLGLEDYSETHAVLIEWPERLEGRLGEPDLRVEIDFAPDGREVKISTLK